MKIKVNKYVASTAAILSVSSLIAARGLAGGMEHYCPAPTFTEVTERWPSVAGGFGSIGLSWNIVTFQTQTGFPVQVPRTYVAPNYPPLECAPPNTPLSSQPGVAGLITAASTWNNVSSNGITVSNFSFSTLPTTTVNALGLGPITVLGATNGLNDVTFWESTAAFLPLGGVGVVAVAVVTATGPTITEFDIAFNAGGAAPVPTLSPPPAPYSFVEDSPTIYPQSNFATTPLVLGISHYEPPSVAYADLVGIAVHEFGHAAGLAHSLVDSRLCANSPICSTQSQVVPDGMFPTMFYLAQGATLLSTGIVLAQTAVPCTGPIITIPAVPSPPLVGTTVPSRGTDMLGRSARTLTRDDISAIAEGYKTLAFKTSLGTILGRVDLNTTGNGLPGAHIVAISTSGDPAADSNRVGTLSYTGGNYRLSGLLPGSYFLFIEPAANDGFFPAASRPNFIQGPLNCTLPTTFAREYWDQSEAFTEAFAMAATPITITAGAIVTRNLFVTQASSDQLFLCTTPAVGVPPVCSSKGQTVTFNGQTTPVTFTVALSGGVPPLTPVMQVIDIMRSSSLLNGQVLDVGWIAHGTTLAFPQTTLLTTDAVGNFSSTVTVFPGYVNTNFFIQLAILDPTLPQGMRLTNTVSCFVAN